MKKLFTFIILTLVAAANLFAAPNDIPFKQESGGVYVNKSLPANAAAFMTGLGAVPITRTVNGKALSANITLTTDDLGAVPTTRKVNNQPLTTNVTITKEDLGLGSSANVTFQNLTTSGVVTTTSLYAFEGLTSGSNEIEEPTFTVTADGDVYFSGVLATAFNDFNVTSNGSVTVPNITFGVGGVAGQVTLSSGAGTISNAAIDNHSIIVFSRYAVSGTPGTNQPVANVSANDGTATVAGLATDNSTYNWVAFKISF